MFKMDFDTQLEVLYGDSNDDMNRFEFGVAVCINEHRVSWGIFVGSDLNNFGVFFNIGNRIK